MYFSNPNNRDEPNNSDIVVSYFEPTSVNEYGEISLPDDIKIDVYPNPFNSTCNIKINFISKIELIGVKILNILGEEVTTEKILLIK